MSKIIPFDLRPLIHYYVSNWKTAEKSYIDYSNLCTVLGTEPEISEEDFEIKFHQRTKYHYYAMKYRGLLPEYDIRFCILSDVLARKSAENSYQDLLEAFGKKIMETADFARWTLEFYYQFFDENYFNFSNLPVEIVEEVMENLEYKSHLILRKVSRGLRTLVDQQKSILKGISVKVHVNRIIAHYNHHDAVYTDNKNSGKGKIIRSDDYLKMALDDLIFALKKPTVQLELLSVNYHPGFVNERKTVEHIHEFSKKLEDILKSLNHKISTKTFEIRGAQCANNILAILPYLKPGTLREVGFDQIYVTNQWWSTEIGQKEIDQIAELEQWKRAKELNLKHSFKMIPEKHWMNFEKFRFDVSFWELMRLSEWEDMRDTFSMSPNFKWCKIDFGKMMTIVFDQVRVHLQLDEHYRYRIPNSNQVLKYEIRNNMHSPIIISKEDYVDLPPVLEEF